jgi:hypothetical protein
LICEFNLLNFFNVFRQSHCIQILEIKIIR